jgi:hypothetical protein
MPSSDKNYRHKSDENVSGPIMPSPGRRKAGRGDLLATTFDP